MMGNTARPKIIIVGAGFGGLFAARELANKPVDVLLIDRKNFHTFTPLLYQVRPVRLIRARLPIRYAVSSAKTRISGCCWAMSPRLIMKIVL